MPGRVGPVDTITAVSAVVVVGAGVVGQVYAGLLADAGHRVCLLARGHRAEQLRRAGVCLERDGVVWSPACEVITDLSEAGPVEVIIVAVRGDQLVSAQALLSAARGPTVVCLANPLGRRGDVEGQVGVGRTVLRSPGSGERSPTMVSSGFMWCASSQPLSMWPPRAAPWWSGCWRVPACRSARNGR